MTLFQKAHVLESERSKYTAVSSRKMSGFETSGKPVLEDAASRNLGPRCILSLQLYLLESKASPKAFGQRNNAQRFLK